MLCPRFESISTIRIDIIEIHVCRYITLYKDVDSIRMPPYGKEDIKLRVLHNKRTDHIQVHDIFPRF
jgi:hypothetical protein